MKVLINLLFILIFLVSSAFCFEIDALSDNEESYNLIKLEKDSKKLKDIYDKKPDIFRIIVLQNPNIPIELIYNAFNSNSQTLINAAKQNYLYKVLISKDKDFLNDSLKSDNPSVVNAANIALNNIVDEENKVKKIEDKNKKEALWQDLLKEIKTEKDDNKLRKLLEKNIKTEQTFYELISNQTLWRLGFSIVYYDFAIEKEFLSERNIKILAMHISTNNIDTVKKFETSLNFYFKSENILKDGSFDDFFNNNMMKSLGRSLAKLGNEKNISELKKILNIDSLPEKVAVKFLFSAIKGLATTDYESGHHYKFYHYSHDDKLESNYPYIIELYEELIDKNINFSNYDIPAENICDIPRKLRDFFYETHNFKDKCLVYETSIYGQQSNLLLIVDYLKNRFLGNIILLIFFISLSYYFYNSFKARIDRKKYSANKRKAITETKEYFYTVKEKIKKDSKIPLTKIVNLNNEINILITNLDEKYITLLKLGLFNKDSEKKLNNLIKNIESIKDEINTKENQLSNLKKDVEKFVEKFKQIEKIIEHLESIKYKLYSEAIKDKYQLLLNSLNKIGDEILKDNYDSNKINETKKDVENFVNEIIIEHSIEEEKRRILTETDEFKILGVKREDTLSVIKKSWIKLITKYHTDMHYNASENKLKEYEEISKIVNAAWDKISKERKDK